MNNNRKGVLLVTLAAISWSFSGVLSKYITWSGLSIAGVRAIPAVFFMALMRGGFRVRLTGANLLGAFGCASTSIIFIVANKLTTSANAIVLQYAMPAVVILLVALVYRQKPGRLDVVTCVCVMLGVILCSVQSLSGGHIAGDLLALLTAFTYALVFFCNRLPGANSMDYNFLGLILCCPFALFALGDPNATFTVGNLLALLAMSVCLALGYFLVSLGLKAVSPVSAALTSNIEPVLNPIWTFLFLGEFPGWLSIAGAVVVLGTVTAYSILSTRKKA